MKTVFADAAYWIATLTPEETGCDTAAAVSRELGDLEFVTTQEVLAQVLNFFASHGRAARRKAAAAVRDILTAPNVMVIAQGADSFLCGLDSYDENALGGYSHTDCISINTMREEGIREVLTANPRFGKAGFRVHLVGPASRNGGRQRRASASTGGRTRTAG